MKITITRMICMFGFYCLIGCAVYESKTLEITKKTASTDVNHVSKQGLCIVAKELSFEEKQMYLGKDPLAYGYEAIFITMESKKNALFSIKNKDIKVMTETGVSLKTVSLEEVLRTSSFSPIPAAIPFWIVIFPGFFFALNIHKRASLANEQMQIDYGEKIFQDTLLNKKKRLSHGVLFVKKSHKESLDHVIFQVKKGKFSFFQVIVPIL